MSKENSKRLTHTPKQNGRTQKRDAVNDFLDVLARLIGVHHLRVTRDEVKPSGPKHGRRKKQTII